MHEYLRSIGFRSIETKKQMDLLEEWVLDRPSRITAVSVDPETTMGMAERDCGGRCGVAVLGEMNDNGDIKPGHTFPYAKGQSISSSEKISYEDHPSRDGFIGMCEDYRLGIALIFDVKNITELMKMKADNDIRVTHDVKISALASEGTVLYPLAEPCKVLQERNHDDERFQETLLSGMDPFAASQEEIERILEQQAVNRMEHLQHMLHRMHTTDIFTLVDNFFMPSGMSSDQYYFMGNIHSVELAENAITKENFYRMEIDSNGFPFVLAINENDLTGVPKPGFRLRAKAWFTGEIKNR